MILKNINDDTCLSDTPIDGWTEISREAFDLIINSRQVVPDQKSLIQSQINTIEAANMLPRVTREFMLTAMQIQADQLGVNPLTNFAYSKVKQLDDQIAALRSQL